MPPQKNQNDGKCCPHKHYQHTILYTLADTGVLARTEVLRAIGDKRCTDRRKRHHQQHQYLPRGGVSGYHILLKAVYTVLKNYRAYVDNRIHKRHSKSGAEQLYGALHREHEVLFPDEQERTALYQVNKTNRRRYRLRHYGGECRADYSHIKYAHRKQVKQDIQYG